MDITIYRSDGNKPMQTITDELLTDEVVATHRGKQEMDEHAQEFMNTTMDTVYRSGVEMAQCIKVAEHIHAPYMYSKITDIQYSVSDTEDVTITLSARRPLIQ